MAERSPPNLPLSQPCRRSPQHTGHSDGISQITYYFEIKLFILMFLLLFYVKCRETCFVLKQD